MPHVLEKHTFLRANTALMLSLVWGGLAVCAFGAVVFDVGRIFAIW
ncbi:MAG: hypothetical protein ACRECO_07310 [Xanthobacteraceae bacterium]